MCPKPAFKEAESGAVIGGRYRLIQVIGSGSMGVVWKAEDVCLHYHLAVKLIRNVRQANFQTFERFLLEATAGARLGAESDHVARTFEYDVDPVYGPFLGMELLDGQPLDRYLAEHGPISPRKARSFLKQIARAVRKAHALGIVIRDIKSANVFLSQHPGEDVRVKLVDFGVVKSLPPGAGPVTTMIAGTPSHMSRELIAGQPIDQRVDVWAVSVTLYHMLTARLPFAGDDYFAVKRSILAFEVEPPSRVVGHLGPRFDGFFETAFAPDISQRFGDIDELESAFAAASRPVPSPRGEPTRRPPPSNPGSSARPAAPSQPSEAPRAADTGAEARARAATVTARADATLKSPISPRVKRPRSKSRRARSRASRRRL